MSRIHVVARDDGWGVRTECASRVASVHNSKDEALREAVSMARNRGRDVVIHGRDNRIQRIITPREIEEGGDCFITTACVNFYGLSDNCYQLITLRKFRDDFLKSTRNGRKLIEDYNRVAPKIVSYLETDKHKNVYFEF